VDWWYRLYGHGDEAVQMEMGMGMGMGMSREMEMGMWMWMWMWMWLPVTRLHLLRSADPLFALKKYSYLSRSQIPKQVTPEETTKSISITMHLWQRWE